MNDVIDNETGEITIAASLTTIEAATRAEIDTLVNTAKKFPRQHMAKIRDTIVELATMDEETAEEMRYAIPRDGKVISGPSIRFAEMVAQVWGNCQIGSRITEINIERKYVEAEGVYIDSQSNMRQVARVRRRISGKSGRIFSDDMVNVTGNACAAIARRNAITAGIPKAVWNKGYLAAEQVIMGTVQTLGTTRAKAIAAFTNFGLTAEQVLELVQVERVEDVGLVQVANMRSMFAMLRNEETTVEDLMRGVKGATTSDHQIVANPMHDDGPAPQKTAAATATTESAGAPADAAADPAPAPADKKPKAGKKAAVPAPEVDESDPLPPAETAAREEPTDDDFPGDTKAAVAEPAKPAKADKPKAAADATPTNEAGYMAYARDWIDGAETASEIDERFRSERGQRNTCSMTPEAMDDLKAFKDAKVASFGG
jgi:hypothetical protein